MKLNIRLLRCLTYTLALLGPQISFASLEIPQEDDRFVFTNSNMAYPMLLETVEKATKRTSMEEDSPLSEAGSGDDYEQHKTKSAKTSKGDTAPHPKPIVGRDLKNPICHHDVLQTLSDGIYLQSREILKGLPKRSAHIDRNLKNYLAYQKSNGWLYYDRIQGYRILPEGITAMNELKKRTEINADEDDFYDEEEDQQNDALEVSFSASEEEEEEEEPVSRNKPTKRLKTLIAKDAKGTSFRSIKRPKTHHALLTHIYNNPGKPLDTFYLQLCPEIPYFSMFRPTYIDSHIKKGHLREKRQGYELTEDGLAYLKQLAAAMNLPADEEPANNNAPRPMEEDKDEGPLPAPLQLAAEVPVRAPEQPQVTSLESLPEPVQALILGQFEKGPFRAIAEYFEYDDSNIPVQNARECAWEALFQEVQQSLEEKYGVQGGKALEKLLNDNYAIAVEVSIYKKK